MIVIIIKYCLSEGLIIHLINHEGESVVSSLKHIIIIIIIMVITISISTIRIIIITSE